MPTQPHNALRTSIGSRITSRTVVLTMAAPSVPPPMMRNADRLANASTLPPSIRTDPMMPASPNANPIGIPRSMRMVVAFNLQPSAGIVVAAC